MSSKQKGDGMGKLELTVKMDYSETYRENDKLDHDLDEHLNNLNRNAFRARTEKKDALETAKADADKFLKLKEAVNNVRQQEAALLQSSVICPSSARLSSASSGNSSSRGGGAGRGKGSVDKNNSRKSSAGGGRKLSAMSSTTLPSQNGFGEGEGSDIVDTRRASSAGSAFHQLQEAPVAGGSSNSSSGVAPVRPMTLTERRWAEEKARFTAKNLFNVRWSNTATVGHFMIDRSTRLDNSGDAGKKGVSSAMPSDRNVSPSSPGYGRQFPGKRSKRNRSAPLFVRLTQGDGDDGLRKPRSRRELQKLSELTSDSFGDVDSVLKRPMSCAGRGGPGGGGGGGGGVCNSGGGRRSGSAVVGSGGGRNVHSVSSFQQDILQRLRGGRSQLQERVSVFLKNMDDFNKRGQKSVLDQILDAT